MNEGAVNSAIVLRNRVDSFPRFPQLPREIRNLIWKYAAPSITHLSIKKLYVMELIPIPSCFHVNREAREEIAKHSRFYINAHRVNLSRIHSELSENPTLRELCKLARHVVFCACVVRYEAALQRTLLDDELFPQVRRYTILPLGLAGIRPTQGQTFEITSNPESVVHLQNEFSYVTVK
ncbi:hypothetical protein K449DRAFT_458830 [Hypoxylon sp. EC38]|nr:hypothetical protein K449DRAFT_458830 [Hypoxylon sp. EC38]